MARNARGSVMNAYLGFIRKKWGKAGYEQCLEALGLEEDFKDGGYYHDEFRENILRWIEREKGVEHISDAGAFVVKNLGILAWLVRFASIKSLAARFPKNYSEIYTFGKVEVDTSKDNRIILQLFDVNRIEESCQSWVGVCRGALEITKTEGSVKKTKCQLEGAEFCEYTIEYK